LKETGCFFLINTVVYAAKVKLSFSFGRYGFLGKKFKDSFGNILGPELSGLVGLKEPRDHGVPYSLTEEFTSVYRMHALLPEELVLRNIKPTTGEDKCPSILEKYTLISH
jgi:alpha-dioxygenase